MCPSRRGDSDRDQGVHNHGVAVFADLLGQHVEPQERVRASVQRPGAEHLKLVIKALGHLARSTTEITTTQTTARPVRWYPGDGRGAFPAVTGGADRPQT